MPASLQGELQPTIYRFRLGGFEVATILDGKSIREGLHPNFGGNASAEAVHALARANAIDTNRFEHPYIPTLQPARLAARSNGARARFVVNSKTLLRIFRHVRHAQLTAHERDPRFFGDRLQLREIPELALAHLDLCDLVVEHPIAQRGQPGLVGFGEHRLGQCLFHSRDV